MAALRWEASRGLRATFAFPRDAGGTQRGAGARESCAAGVVGPAGGPGPELGGHAAGTQGVCPSAELEVWRKFIRYDWCGRVGVAGGGGGGRSEEHTAELQSPRPL